MPKKLLLLILELSELKKLIKLNTMTKSTKNFSIISNNRQPRKYIHIVSRYYKSVRNDFISDGIMDIIAKNFI